MDRVFELLSRFPWLQRTLFPTRSLERSVSKVVKEILAPALKGRLHITQIRLEDNIVQLVLFRFGTYNEAGRITVDRIRGGGIHYTLHGNTHVPEELRRTIYPVEILAAIDSAFPVDRYPYRDGPTQEGGRIGGLEALCRFRDAVVDKISSNFEDTATVLPYSSIALVVQVRMGMVEFAINFNVVAPNSNPFCTIAVKLRIRGLPYSTSVIEDIARATSPSGVVVCMQKFLEDLDLEGARHARDHRPGVSPGTGARRIVLRRGA